MSTRLKQLCLALVLLVRISETVSSDEATLLAVHEKMRVNSIAFSPDSTKLVAGCGVFHGLLQDPEPGRLMMWQLPEGELETSLKAHADGVVRVAFSPDGKILASAGFDGRLQIRDPMTARDVASYDIEVGPLQSMAFSNDGRYLAVGGWGDDVSEAAIFDVAARKIVKRLPAHKDEISAISFLFGAADVVTGSADGIVKVWDVAGGTLKRKLGRHSGTIQALAASSDGKLLAVASGDMFSDPNQNEPPGELKVWNATTWAVRFAISLPETPFTVAFAPDGTHLAVAGDSKSIRFVDLSGQEVHVLQSKSNSVLSVTFSADGNMFAAGGSGGVVELWPVPHLANGSSK